MSLVPASPVRRSARTPRRSTEREKLVRSPKRIVPATVKPDLSSDRSRIGPAMARGELYSLEQLMALFGMSIRTLAKWRAAGLKVRFPGTRRGYVFSDDVFEVIAKLSEVPEGLPAIVCGDVPAEKGARR